MSKPIKHTVTMNEKKNRYSDEELQEFKEIILEKLEKARRDYELLKADVTNTDGNDTADTSPTSRYLKRAPQPSARKRAADWHSDR